MAALANAPGVLDLYLWLVWKTWSLNNHTARIPSSPPAVLPTNSGLADILPTDSSDENSPTGFQK
jgi:hypothetical protein